MGNCGCNGKGGGASSWSLPEAAVGNSAPLVPDGQAPAAAPSVARGMRRHEIPWWVWAMGAVLVYVLVRER